MEMDKSRKMIWVIKAVLTVLLIIVLLGSWPGYLIHDQYVSRTISDRYEPSDILIANSTAAQYFVPQQAHMCSIEFAVLFNEANAGNAVAEFVLCEESGHEVLSQEIRLEQMESGCYYTVEIKERLKAGKTYYWILVCSDAENIDLQVMYTNHITDQAPENMLFLLNDEQYGEVTQTVSQYSYLAHPDKIIIFGNYWMGSILIYIICMDLISRFPKSKRIQKLTQ